MWRFLKKLNFPIFHVFSHIRYLAVFGFLAFTFMHWRPLVQKKNIQNIKIYRMRRDFPVKTLDCVAISGEISSMVYFAIFSSEEACSHSPTLSLVSSVVRSIFAWHIALFSIPDFLFSRNLLRFWEVIVGMAIPILLIALIQRASACNVRPNCSLIWRCVSLFSTWTGYQWYSPSSSNAQ